MNNKPIRPKNLNLVSIKFPITAIISILHRISGVIMGLSLPYFIYLFGLSLHNEQGYESVLQTLQNGYVQLLLAPYLWLLIHHLVAGVRFLLIDFDLAVEKRSANQSAWVVLILGILVGLLLIGGML